MNNFFLVIGLFIGQLAWAQPSAELRLSYRDATKSAEQTNAFYKQVENIQKDGNAVMVAYKGAGITLLARQLRLTERAGRVREGVAWIEHAIERDPKNVEIRLIRLSVQEHLPKFLKYNQHIDEDKQFIRDALPKLKDKTLIAMIEGYFKDFSDK